MDFLKNLFSPGKEAFIKPEVLIEERSPNCPVTAFVEQDNRVAYFYLWSPEVPDFGVKSCWIRNLRKAPSQNETHLMEQGLAPMLTSAFCKFPDGQKPLNKDDLHIVWFEEGDGAALIENGEILAIIPSWGGVGNFRGYARDCKGESDLCWELQASNTLRARVQQAQEFWESWDKELTPFDTLQPMLLNAYAYFFGESDKYFVIDGERWPPKGLYVLNGERKIIFATVGVSLLPQPTAEMYTENRFELDRVELGLIVNGGLTDDRILKLGAWISGQTPIPWNKITFLGEGHTISTDPMDSSSFTAVILTNQLDVLPAIELDSYRGSDINFFWMVPITERERQFAIEKGSEKLLKKLNRIGDEIFSLERKEVV